MIITLWNMALHPFHIKQDWGSKRWSDQLRAKEWRNGKTRIQIQSCLAPNSRCFQLTYFKSMFKIPNSCPRNSQASHAAGFSLIIKNHHGTLKWWFCAWNQHWNKRKERSFILACFLPSFSQPFFLIVSKVLLWKLLLSLL